MSSQLIVGFIEVTFDGRVLDGSVHPFDLAVGPGVLGLGQPMIDIVEGAGVFEGMRVEELPIGDHLFDLSRRPCFASGVGEVGPVVGEDGMDPVGDGLDQVAQEICGRLARHLFVQLDEGELRGPVDCDDEMELALSGSSLGDVDMEVANRIGLKLPLGRSFAFDLGQPRYSMALQAPMQRRARQMRDGRLQSIKAVVERQQSMPPEGDDYGLFLDGQDR